MSAAAVTPPPITVTVTAADRTIEADIPARMPVAEAVPALARRLGVLDAAIVHGGYQLLGEDGVPLPPDRGMADLGIAPGAHLTLEVSLLAPSLVVYDDVVEAVGDIVARETEPWTPRDGAATVSTISGGILLIAALALAAIPPSTMVGAAALGAAVLVLAMAAVLGMRGWNGPALLTGSMSVLFAAVGGYHLVRAVWPQAGYSGAMVGIGAALLLWGLAGAVAIRSQWVYAAGPILAGLVLASAGAMCWLQPTWFRGTWPMVLGVAAVIAGGLPWIALSTARLTVDSPQSEADIFKIPDDIDAAVVAARYRRGNQWLVAGRVAALVVIACTAPAVAALDTPAGLVECMAAVGAMMLGTRTIIQRRDVLMVMVGSAIVLVGAVVGAVAAHPPWRPAIGTVLCAVAVGTVAVNLLSGSPSLRGARIADSLESLCLVAILPAAVVAAGFVGG